MKWLIMKLLLDNIRGGIEEDVLRIDFKNLALLPTDKWIASSLMQKAIRRGDSATAIRAAMTLHRHDARGLLRRLQNIAFEAIGIADPNCVIETVAACSDKAWRDRLCSEMQIIAYLCNRLANAAKDRSTDYLICTAVYHPSFEEERDTCGTLSMQDRIRVAADETQCAVSRAIATWFAGGIDWARERRVGKGDLPTLIEAYADLGVPRDILAATHQAAKSVRDPIVLMLPVLWSLTVSSSKNPTFEAERFEAPVIVEGVPTYALDKHTRLGKRAARILLKTSGGFRACLEWHLPDSAWKRVVDMALFYAEGRMLDRKLIWQTGADLEKLGTAADMLKVGVPEDHIYPIINAVRDHLWMLDRIRADLLAGHVQEHQRDLFAGGE